MCVSADRRVWDAVDSARVARGAMGCRHSSPCAVAPTSVALCDEETLALERVVATREVRDSANSLESATVRDDARARVNDDDARAKKDHSLAAVLAAPASPRLAPRAVAPPRASLLVALRRETATFVRASRRRGCSTPSPTVIIADPSSPGLLDAFAYSDASSAPRAARLAPPRRPSSAVTEGYHGGDAAAPRGGVREPRAWSSSGWDPPGGWSYEREETTRLIAPSAAPVPDRRTVRASSSSARDGNPPGRERSRDEDGVFRDAFGDVPGTVPDSDRGGGGGTRARALAPRAPVAFAAERGRDADRTRRGFLEQHPIDPTAIDRTSRNGRDLDPSVGGRSVARHHPSLAAGRRLDAFGSVDRTGRRLRVATDANSSDANSSDASDGTSIDPTRGSLPLRGAPTRLTPKTRLTPALPRRASPRSSSYSPSPNRPGSVGSIRRVPLASLRSPTVPPVPLRANAAPRVVAPVSEKMRALKAKLRTLQVPGGGNSDGSAVEREQRRSDATRAKQPLPRRSRAEQGARQGKGLERPRDESGETGPRAARRAPRASLGGSLGGSHRPRSHLPTRTYF